jgi:hypothetical protein
VPYRRYLEASLVCPFCQCMHTTCVAVGQSRRGVPIQARCLSVDLTAWRSPSWSHSAGLTALIDRWCIAAVDSSIQQLPVMRRRCGVVVRMCDRSNQWKSGRPSMSRLPRGYLTKLTTDISTANFLSPLTSTTGLATRLRLPSINTRASDRFSTSWLAQTG